MEEERPPSLRMEEERPIDIYLSGSVTQFLPEMVLTVVGGDAVLTHPVKLVTKVLQMHREWNAAAEDKYPKVVYSHVCDIPGPTQFECWDVRNYTCKDVAVPRRTGKYLQVMYLGEPLSNVARISQPFVVKHGPPSRIIVRGGTIGEQLEQLEVEVVDMYGNLCYECPGKLWFTLTVNKARILPRDGINKPFQLLSSSTGDLIEGACRFGRFDKFEIGTGIEGIYHMQVWYGREDVISSPIIAGLITSGSIAQYVFKRSRELQYWTKELESKAQLKSEIPEGLDHLRARLATLQIKDRLLEAGIDELREKKRRLKTVHVKDERFLVRERLLDREVKTRENVKKAIEELPAPLSSPLGICERRRQSLMETGSPSNDIFDMVVMLAEVEDLRFNSILSVYLGVSNMLTIVCETRKEQQELKEICESNGRFEILSIEALNASSRDVPTYYYHRQRLLKLPEPSWIDGERPEGFLGFAVNFIHLKPDHLNLRAILFYHLLGDAHVYDTEGNMKIGLQSLRHPQGAMSLDGSLVTYPHRHRVGRSDPTITFPSMRFDERFECSLVPPGRDVFERERTWHDLRMQIMERREKEERCERRIDGITAQIAHWESMFARLPARQNKVEKEVEYLAKEIATLRLAADRIDYTLTRREEYKMFLVKH